MAKYQINIGIDARLYGLEHAGLGRYTKNLVDRAVKNKDIHWTLFLNPKYGDVFEANSNCTIIKTAIRHYSLDEQTQFLSLLNKQNLDLLHVPHFNIPLFYRRPFVVTIHDILWHQVRGGSVTTLSPLKYYLKYVGYKMIVKHAVTEAKTIFVPSEYVKSDVTKTFKHVDPSKIHVTYEGVSHASPLSSHPSPLSSPPSLLYIGSAYPHKNLPIILKAMSILKKTDIPNVHLTIVGSRSIFLDKVKKETALLGLTNNVTFAGFKTDEEVALIYKNTFCLVHPSKSEGFGLTGLEAMASGVPVISSDSTCLPEIYKDAALFFDPDNADMLAQKIDELYKNPAMRNELIKKGLARVKQFSWDTMVNQTIKSYKSIKTF